MLFAFDGVLCALGGGLWVGARIGRLLRADVLTLRNDAITGTSIAGNGAVGGRGGDGAGGGGSAGGAAVGAIYNAGGAVLTIQDTFISGSARGGVGGNGGNGGQGAIGGQGGASGGFDGGVAPP